MSVAISAGVIGRLTLALLVLAAGHIGVQPPSAGNVERGSLPVSWITRPYLMLIEPFRRVLYPAMLRRIRRAWVAAYAPNFQM